MWSLNSPWYLLLLMLVPVGVYVRHFRKRKGNRIAFPLSVWKGESFKKMLKGITAIRLIAFTCFWAGVVLLIIALAGPEKITRERMYLTKGVNIMVVIDESPSMAAKDFPPENRFEAAKSVITQFINNREHDPIGLVSFGKEAALRVPPTLDYQRIIGVLKSLSIMDLGDGTAIGMGLAVALLHLEQTTAKEKIIILITDGKNNAGEISPKTSVAMARSMGIRVYSIGVGTDREVPLEFTDPRTGKHYEGVLQGSFDEEILKRIAAKTGGRYYSASSPGSLSYIFNAIDAMEAEEKVTKMNIRNDPFYMECILAGLCLVFLEFFLRRLFLQEVFI